MAERDGDKEKRNQKRGRSAEYAPSFFISSFKVDEGRFVRSVSVFSGTNVCERNAKGKTAETKDLKG